MNKVRVLVDAEYTYMNPALSLVTMAMMKKFNKDGAWIWNTYQCYLKVNIAISAQYKQHRAGWCCVVLFFFFCCFLSGVQVSCVGSSAPVSGGGVLSGSEAGTGGVHG